MPHHTVFVLLQDHPGALHRCVTLFRRRHHNVVSLRVEPAESAGLSRMTVVVDAPSTDQIIKELERLIEVLAVRDVTASETPPLHAVLPLRMQADGCCDEVEVA